MGLKLREGMIMGAKGWKSTTEISLLLYFDLRKGYGCILIGSIGVNYTTDI